MGREVDMFAKPSVWESMLFEQPWPLAVAFAVLGLGLLHLGRQRQQRRMALVGLMALFGAAATLGAGAFVTTEREAVHAQAKGLCVAAAPLDSPKIRPFFAPNAALQGSQGEVWFELDAMLAWFQKIDERAHVEKHDLRGFEASRESSRRMLAQVKIRTWFLSDIGLRPVDTEWLATYERRDADAPWLIVRLKWMTLNGEPAPERGRIP